MTDSQETQARTPAIIPLTVDHDATVGAMLARAFQDDPIKSRFNPDPERRAAFLPRVFASVVRATAIYGGHMTTTEDYSAAALWSPPGKELDFMSIVHGYGLEIPRLAFHMPWSAMPGMFSLFSTLPQRRKANMREPHWYLTVLGVDPSRQGEGLGTMLVREGLSRADADRTPAYLETETEGNVAFYERLGFKVLEVLTIERLGCPMWLMCRDSAGST